MTTKNPQSKPPRRSVNLPPFEYRIIDIGHKRCLVKVLVAIPIPTPADIKLPTISFNTYYEPSVHSCIAFVIHRADRLNSSFQCIARIEAWISPNEDVLDPGTPITDPIQYAIEYRYPSPGELCIFSASQHPTGRPHCALYEVQPLDSSMFDMNQIKEMMTDKVKGWHFGYGLTDFVDEKPYHLSCLFDWDLSLGMPGPYWTKEHINCSDMQLKSALESMLRGPMSDLAWNSQIEGTVLKANIQRASMGEAITDQVADAADMLVTVLQDKPAFEDIRGPYWIDDKYTREARHVQKKHERTEVQVAHEPTPPPEEAISSSHNPLFHTRNQVTTEEEMLEHVARIDRLLEEYRDLLPAGSSTVSDSGSATDGDETDENEQDSLDEFTLPGRGTSTAVTYRAATHQSSSMLATQLGALALTTVKKLSCLGLPLLVLGVLAARRFAPVGRILQAFRPSHTPMLGLRAGFTLFS